jgi:GNAT superfamily N-acetyltransferase
MNNDVKELCELRLYRPTDFNFIMATFLRGLYYGDSWFSLMPKDVFMNAYKQVVEALINKHTVYVACLKEDPDVIMGYSIISKDETAMHWVFVKTVWRKQGIGRALIPKTVSAVTHLTDLGRKLMTKIPDCTFNPFLL